MTEYTDKNRIVVKIGDIIKYDEPNSNKWGKAIYEIVYHRGELAGVLRVGYPYWTFDEQHTPLRLIFFCIKPDTVMIDSEIIGNIQKNADMLTIAYAEILFPNIIPIVKSIK